MADLDLATILADGEYLRRSGDVLVGDIPGGAGGGQFDVTAYGAVGDGTTDNAAAITAAITAASAAGGGVVTFPAGDFAYTGIIHFQSKVSVAGAGKTATLLRPQTVDSLLLFSATADPLTEMTVYRWGFIRDFTVRGELANVGVRLGMIGDVGVYNVMVEDTLQAGWQLWATQNGKFYNTGCVKFDGIGVDFDYSAGGNEWFGHYSNQAGTGHVRFGNGDHLGAFATANDTSNNEFYGSYFERNDATIQYFIQQQGNGLGNRFYGSRLSVTTTPTLSPFYLVKVDGNARFLDFVRCRFYDGAGNTTRVLNQTAGSNVTFDGCTSAGLSATDPWMSATVEPTVRTWRSEQAIPATSGLHDVAQRAIITYTGTAVTGVLTDGGNYLRFTGTNPTYTLPPNSSVAFPVGTQIDGIGTATAMTLIQGAGVTITKARTLVTVGAGSGWTAIKTGTNTFDLHGDFV